MRLPTLCGIAMPKRLGVAGALTAWFVFATCSLALADGPPASTRTGAAATNARPKEGAIAPLSGVVVDEDGKPVPGAKVAYSWWANPRSQEIDAMCDDEGRFTLPPSPTWADHGAWPPGHLWAGAAGFRLRYQRLFEEGKRSKAENLRLVLPARGGVSIAIRDPDGKPLSAARVAATTVRFGKAGAIGVPAVLRALAEATTDDHGGRVSGRFVAPRADLVRGLRIVLTTYPGESIQPDQTMGSGSRSATTMGGSKCPR